jgi:hypothetical protein
MRETFRGLVVVSTALYLVFWFLPFIDWRWYSPEVLELRGMSGFDAKLVWPIFVDYLLLAAWLLAAIGMYFFRASARSLFLWLYIITTLVDPFRGTSVFTGVDVMLFSLSTVMDGAVIAIAYLTSVERLFVQRATDLT